jgi:hypothetical protein
MDVNPIVIINCCYFVHVNEKYCAFEITWFLDLEITFTCMNLAMTQAIELNKCFLGICGTPKNMKNEVS